MKAMLEKLHHASIHVIDASIPKSDYLPLDLSIHNLALAQIDITSASAMENYINELLHTAGSKVAYGGYLEQRNIYKRSAYFNEQADPRDERNIHLGMDIWAAAGTPVLAALDGEVHSFQNNTHHGDYGPTIILKHVLAGFAFYTLYGHLSMSSISTLSIGKQIAKGERIAYLGDSSINGDYAPHLHFQIILDIQDYFGDYPGVCSVNQLEFYKSNCPDPNLLLGL